MSRKLKEIRRILTEHDVRDPRGALVAVEQTLNSKNPNPVKKVKPLITASLTKTGNGQGEVAVVTAEGFGPKHLVTLIDTLGEFGNEKFGECPGCENCQPTGNADISPITVELLRDIVAKIKAAQPKKEGE